jgi:hypothetical protein
MKNATKAIPMNSAGQQHVFTAAADRPCPPGARRHPRERHTSRGNGIELQRIYKQD